MVAPLLHLNADAGRTPETMFPVSRRALVGALACSPVLLAGCARGQKPDFRFRVATNIAPTHPLNVRLSEAARRVGDATRGKVIIELYPAGQLGSDTDMLSQVRNGAIDFLSLSGLIGSLLVPEAALSGIGFAFETSSQLFEAMDGSVGAAVRRGFSRHGLYAFPHVFENGFRQITTSQHKVSVPADLQGLKIRVPPGAIFSSLIESFGAMPTSLNFSELYTALQTHVVDGQENPLFILSSSKLFEVQRYCALTNHMWDGFWMLSNADRYSRLPLDVRNLLEFEFQRAALLQRADLAKSMASLPAELSANGVSFIVPDRARFRATLTATGYYRFWQDRLGTESWRTLESVVGELR